MECQKTGSYYKKVFFDVIWFMERNSHSLLTIMFCVSLLSFLWFNFLHLKNIMAEQQTQSGSLQETRMRIENKFQESIRHRNSFIDFYGLAMRALQLKVIGNFDFVQDECHIMQRPDKKIEIDTFLQNMMDLQKAAAASGSSLLYVSLPDKAKYLTLSESDMFCFFGQNSGYVGERLRGKMDCLVIEDLMQTDTDAPTFDDFYFKTDVHLTTYGEFWMAKMIAAHFYRKYGMRFFDREKVFDLRNYEISRYEFLGNTARSAGKFFAGTDCFEIFHPTFDTNIVLDNPLRSERKRGDFEYALLSGYEERKNIDKYTYWVTNYGRFTSPYYKYVNLNAPVSAPHILVISDSIFMRGCTYLLLASKEITILDPRFFGGTAYLADALQEDHYDAVVVIADASHFFTSKFNVNGLALPDLVEKSGQTADYWIGINGVCLNTCNGKETGDAQAVFVPKDAGQVELVGWAADFQTGAPLSALYLQIGDKVVQCEYGLERRDVSRHYQNERLQAVGFSVTFPASYLRNGEVRELSFVQVGTDGTYRYAPVTYRLRRDG